MVPGAAARRRRADQPGVGRGLRRHRLARRSTTTWARQPFDWIAGVKRLQRLQRLGDRRRSRQAAATGRDASSKPSLPLAKYAGTYRDAWYGDVDDRRRGRPARRSASRTRRSWWATSCTGSTTPSSPAGATAELRADAFVTFPLDPDGKVDQVKMVPESAAVDFSFDFQDLLLEPVN